jgi:hypothetical protein
MTDTMASPLDSILDLVKRTVQERGGQRKSGSLGASVFDKITDMISQRSNAAGRRKRNVRPASEDPYGDPADEKGSHKVKPASADPYGDPADKK